MISYVGIGLNGVALITTIILQTIKLLWKVNRIWWSCSKKRRNE